MAALSRIWAFASYISIFVTSKLKRTSTKTMQYLWNVWRVHEHSSIGGCLCCRDLNCIHTADHSTHPCPMPRLVKPPLTFSSPDIIQRLDHVINGVVSRWKIRKREWKGKETISDTKLKLVYQSAIPVVRTYVWIQTFTNKIILFKIQTWTSVIMTGSL